MRSIRSGGASGCSIWTEPPADPLLREDRRPGAAGPAASRGWRRGIRSRDGSGPTPSPRLARARGDLPGRRDRGGWGDPARGPLRATYPSPAEPAGAGSADESRVSSCRKATFRVRRWCWPLRRAPACQTSRTSAVAPLPARAAGLPHRGNGRDTLPPGRGSAHRRCLRLCGAATARKAGEASGLHLHVGRHRQDCGARARPGARRSPTSRRRSSPIFCARASRSSAFDQHSIAGILAMIRTSSARWWGQQRRPRVSVRELEARLAEVAGRAQPASVPASISRSWDDPGWPAGARSEGGPHCRDQGSSKGTGSWLGEQPRMLPLRRQSSRAVPYISRRRRPITSVDGALRDPAIMAHWQRCEASGLPSLFRLSADGQHRLVRMPCSATPSATPCPGPQRSVDRSPSGSSHASAR